MYEGGTRVPSFMYWKGKLTPLATESMVTVQDVLPTLMAAAGIETTVTTFDGTDRWRQITSGEATANPDYVVQARGSEAFYRFPWKLIRLTSGELELYNLLADPAEQNNLAAQETTRAEELSAALDAFPRGESVHAVPIHRQVMDMDFFGGEEIYPPWASVVR